MDKRGLFHRRVVIVDGTGSGLILRWPPLCSILAVLGVLLTGMVWPHRATAATLSFAPATYTVPEAEPHLLVGLVLSAPECNGILRVPESVAIIRSIAVGTATAGDDFTLVAEQVPLGGTGMPPIAIDRLISGLILDDAIFEGDQTFQLRLSTSQTTAECQPNGGVPFDVPLDVGSPATVTIIDDEDQPTISIGDVSRAEGNTDTNPTTTFLFPVMLSAAAEVEVRVTWTTMDGTATVGDNDYIPQVGQMLTIAPGQTGGMIEVGVVGDQTFEDDETFSVVLMDPGNAEIGDDEAVGTIFNDDEVGTISIGDLSLNEGNSGTTTFSFPVTLSAAAGVLVSVTCKTMDGTATAADSDYLEHDELLEFMPGETEMPCNVEVVGDQTFEDDETFSVALMDPENAVIAEATGTIKNDDNVGPISIGDLSLDEGDSGTTPFSFPVTLSAAAGVLVSVTCKTMDGTATAADSDYLEHEKLLEFMPGETEMPCDVDVVGDQVFEDDETFFVVLMDSEDVVIAEGTGTIVNDDPEPGGPGPGDDDDEDDDDDDPEPDPPSQLRIVSGDGQSGLVGGPLSSPLVVEVLDQNDDPVPGVTVSWEVQGDAELENEETTTDDQGQAANTVTLGPTSGPIEVVASVEGLEDVTFTLTAIDPNIFDGPEVPVARALSQVCSSEDISGNLRAICMDFAGLSAEQQRQALSAIAHEEASAQSSVSADAQATQVSNVGSRLAALRGGGPAVSSDQLAFRLDGVTLSSGVIAGLFSPPREEVDVRKLLQAQYGSGTALAKSAGASKRQSASTGDEETRLGFFVNGSLGNGNRPATRRESGFDFDTLGITAGVDYRLGDDLVLGGSLGYLSTDVDLEGDGGELDVEGYSLSSYGMYYRKRTYLDWIVSYGQNDLTIDRGIDFPGRARQVASGSSDGEQLALGLGGGIDENFGALALSVFARFDYLEVKIDSYRETGAPGFNLEIDGQTVESLLGNVSLQLSYAVSLKKYAILLPALRLGYRHEFEDDSYLIAARFVDDPRGTQFAIPTEDPDRDYFKAGLGLSATFTHGRQAYVFYEKDLDREDLNLYLISFGYRFVF